jgi:hypothetical protein
MMEARMGGRGAIAASGKYNDIVRKGEQAQETGLTGRLLRAGERTASSPGGRAVAGVWHGWVHAIEDGLLRTVEEASHHAHMGKALRETGLIDNYRSVLKAQNDTMKSLIEDRLTPNAADAMARKVMDMYGNWTAQTPMVKGFVSKFAPFGLWYLNSLRWLYRLPLTHPVKAGVLAAMYKATERERAEMGQGYQSKELAGKKPVPAWIQGSIPMNLPLVGKVKAVPSYYSPMGALGAEYGQTAAEQLLPFVSSPIAALQGINPLSHEKLTGPEKEELGPSNIGLNFLAEALGGPVPLATQAQTLMERGGKRYGTANWITDLAHYLGGKPTVKPGTEHTLKEVLGKMIMPTRIIRPKAEAATTGKGGASMGEARQAIRAARAAGGGAGASGAALREAREAFRKQRREAVGAR